MKQLIILGLIYLTLAFPKNTLAIDISEQFSSLPCSPSQNANLVISNSNSGTPISLSTSSQWAGSISSLKINGQETLANYDPGLLLQYAFQLGGTNEAENPTEGGGAGSNPSNSIFIEGCQTNRIIYTKSKMAYWYPFNNQSLSPFIMSKIVEIGSNNNPSLIRFLVKIESPVASKTWQLETPTGYHTGEFNQLSTYNPLTKELTPIDQSKYTHLNSDADDYLTDKIIVLSNDNYSLIPYMSNLSNYIPSYPGKYYFAKFNNYPLVKWSIFTYKEYDPNPNVYYYESYLLISPRDQVKANIENMLNKDNHLPVGNLDGISPSGLVQGWAADKNYSRIPVHFYLDNTYELGGALIGTTQTHISRSDVSNSIGYGGESGFSFQIPLEYLNQIESHKLYIYAINLNPEGVSSGPPTLLNPSGSIIPSDQNKNGDFNQDGRVNIFDYNLIATYYGTTYTILDFNILKANFGK